MEPDCRRFRSMSERAFDGELRPEEAEAFEAHRGTCAECRAAFQTERAWRESMEVAAPLSA
jgi:anti-sigma factor RsiW